MKRILCAIATLALCAGIHAQPLPRPPGYVASLASVSADTSDLTNCDEAEAGSGINSGQACLEQFDAAISAAGGGGGSSIILDLGDDESNESAGLLEIATSAANSIFSEPAPNKLLIDVSQPWPTATALAADPADCISGEATRGIAADGSATAACFAVVVPTAIDSESELEAFIGGVNLIIATEIDTVAKIEALTSEDILTAGETHTATFGPAAFPAAGTTQFDVDNTEWANGDDFCLANLEGGACEVAVDNPNGLLVPQLTDSGTAIVSRAADEILLDTNADGTPDWTFGQYSASSSAHPTEPGAMCAKESAAEGGSEGCITVNAIAGDQEIAYESLLANIVVPGLVNGTCNDECISWAIDRAHNGGEPFKLPNWPTIYFDADNGSDTNIGTRDSPLQDAELLETILNYGQVIVRWKGDYNDPAGGEAMETWDGWTIDPPATTTHPFAAYLLPWEDGSFATFDCAANPALTGNPTGNLEPVRVLEDIYIGKAVFLHCPPEPKGTALAFHQGVTINQIDTMAMVVGAQFLDFAGQHIHGLRSGPSDGIIAIGTVQRDRDLEDFDEDCAGANCADTVGGLDVNVLSLCTGHQTPHGACFQTAAGTADSGSATTLVDAGLILSTGLTPSGFRFTTDDYFNGGTIELLTGTGSPDTQTVTDYNAANGTVTVASWTGASPDGTTTYELSLADGTAQALGRVHHSETADEVISIGNVYRIQNTQHDGNNSNGPACMLHDATTSTFRAHIRDSCIPPATMDNPIVQVNSAGTGGLKLLMGDDAGEVADAFVAQSTFFPWPAEWLGGKAFLTNNNDSGVASHAIFRLYQNTVAGVYTAMYAPGQFSGDTVTFEGQCNRFDELRQTGGDAMIIHSSAGGGGAVIANLDGTNAYDTDDGGGDPDSFRFGSTQYKLAADVPRADPDGGADLSSVNTDFFGSTFEGAEGALEIGGAGTDTDSFGATAAQGIAASGREACTAGPWTRAVPAHMQEKLGVLFGEPVTSFTVGTHWRGVGSL